MYLSESGFEENVRKFKKNQEKTKNFHKKLTDLSESMRNIQASADNDAETRFDFSSLCTHLMRLNSCMKAAKQINVNRTNGCEDVTANQFTLNFMLKEAEIVADVKNETKSTNHIANFDYDRGHVGQCYISHIVDEHKGICFILDSTRMPDSSVFFANEPKLLAHVPAPGEMFTYYFQRKFLMRAVRCLEKINTMPNAHFQYSAMLIDLGCLVHINAENGLNDHFEIDEAVKKIPGCAIKCQVVRNSSQPNLFSLLHTCVHFKISKLESEVGVLYIQILTEDKNPFRTNSKVGTDDTSFYSYFHCVNIPKPCAGLFLRNKNEICKSFRPPIAEISKSVLENGFDKPRNGELNPFKFSNGSMDNQNEMANYHQSQISMTEQELNSKSRSQYLDLKPFCGDRNYYDMDSMNECQLNNLYDLAKIRVNLDANVDLENTSSDVTIQQKNSNASKKFRLTAALNGLNCDWIGENSNDPKDSLDETPAITETLEGNGTPARMETLKDASFTTHENRIQKLADSFFNNDQPDVCDGPCIKLDAYHTHLLPSPKYIAPFSPSINETITVMPSFVVDVEQFYAFLPYQANQSMNICQFSDLINSEENRSQYIRLETLPAINEMIFAEFRGQIYRAIVTAHYDEHYIQAFYIDFGNCENVFLEQTYKYDLRWSTTPAYAFLCRLNRLRKVRVVDGVAIEAVKQLILQKMLQARVVNVTQLNGRTTVVVDLFDENHIDVGAMLCRKGFAIRV